MHIEKVKFEDIELELIRSNRKTISISIQKTGKVVVRAPLHLPEKEIRKWVFEKADWIHKNQTEMKQKQAQIKVRKYCQGEQYYFQGKKYTLKFKQRENISAITVMIKDAELIIEGCIKEGEMVSQVLKQWYICQAEIEFHQRVQYYALRMGALPRKIRIKDQRTRWGSCSSKGNLNFNWRLIMAPPEVLDYVVVHELAHLKHMNHGEEFWKWVGEILPDYQIKRSWLREQGNQMLSDFPVLKNFT